MGALAQALFDFDNQRLEIGQAVHPHRVDECRHFTLALDQNSRQRSGLEGAVVSVVKNSFHRQGLQPISPARLHRDRTICDGAQAAGVSAWREGLVERVEHGLGDAAIGIVDKDQTRRSPLISLSIHGKWDDRYRTPCCRQVSSVIDQRAPAAAEQ